MRQVYPLGISIVMVCNRLPPLIYQKPAHHIQQCVSHVLNHFNHFPNICFAILKIPSPFLPICLRETVLEAKLIPRSNSTFILWKAGPIKRLHTLCWSHPSNFVGSEVKLSSNQDCNEGFCRI